MIDLNKLTELEKASKQSFNQQKMMIKKLMSGQQVLCKHCQKMIMLNLPKDKASELKGPSTISCAKGCTDIQLDFSL